MIGIKACVTLERTLYLELPTDSKEEDILKEAKKEIINPIDALRKVSEILNKTNIRIQGLDLNDWSITNSNYEIIKK